MSVYDSDKKEKRSLLDRVSDKELQHLTDINPEQEEAMEREAYSGAADDIAKREAGESPDGKGGTPRAAQQEADELADKTDDDTEETEPDAGWDYNENETKSGKRRFRGKITKKRAGLTAGGLLGVGGIVGIMFLASGPAAFTQLSSLLGDFHNDNNINFSDGRLTRLWRNLRGRGASNNLGRVGDRYARKIDARLTAIGVTPVYDNAGIRRYDFDLDQVKARRYVDQLRAKGHTINTNGRTAVWDTPRGGERTEGIRSFIDDLRIVSAEDGISNALTHRLLKGRSGAGFHPLRNFYREAGEKFVDFAKSVKKSRMDAARTGNLDTPRAPAESPDADARAQADAANSHLPDDLQGDSPSAIAANIRAGIAGALGIAGLYSIACSVDEVGEAVNGQRLENLILPMLRLGQEALAMGSQVQFADGVNSEEMGALYTRFSGDTDIGELSAFASDSIQAEMGNEQIGTTEATKGPRTGQLVRPADLPPEAKPGRTQSPVFAYADDLTISERLCDTVNAPLPAGFAVADILDVIAAGLTGGGASAAASATVNAAMAGLGIALGDTIDSWVRALAGNYLECLDGPYWGSCVNFGARLGANDRAISSGGIALTPDEEQELSAVRMELKKEDMKTKSLYARYLDMKDPDSLFAKAAMQNPRFFFSSNNLAYGLSSPVKSFSNIFTNFGNMFGGQAKALSVDYDYGFPEFGFNKAEMKPEGRLKDLVENPYKNAKWIEKRLPPDQQCDSGPLRLHCLNEMYGEDCFQTIISGSGEIITFETVDYKEILSKIKCLDIGRTNEALTRYRFYIADTIAAKTGLCYESKEGEDDGACDELGLGAPVSTGGSGSTALGGPLPTGPVDASQIVDIPGLTSGCHRSIAANVTRMIQAAAADGVTLTGSCWRDPQQQIALRMQNCGTSHYAIYQMPSGECSPPTAIPGTSNHERGLAIDFRNCSSTCFNWLSAHAADYGLHNFPPEPWHWSVDGS